MRHHMEKSDFMKADSFRFSNLSPLVVSVILASAVCGSCGSESGTTADSESVVAVDSVVEEVPADTVFHFSSAGVGPLEQGMPVESWPEKVEGLYDNVDVQGGGDANQYEFFLSERPMVTVLDFGEGKADLVILSDPAVKVKVGERELGLGDSFSELLDNPEVKASWEQLDDDGMWYWNLGGMWFAPKQDMIPEDLARKLYDPATPPSREDFPPEVGIGYIANGLPF